MGCELWVKWGYGGDEIVIGVWVFFFFFFLSCFVGGFRLCGVCGGGCCLVGVCVVVRWWLLLVFGCWFLSLSLSLSVLLVFSALVGCVVVVVVALLGVCGGAMVVVIGDWVVFFSFFFFLFC